MLEESRRIKSDIKYFERPDRHGGEREMEKEKEPKIYRIAIQDNNLLKAEICPICEKEFEPVIGPQAFLAGTWDPVCLPCSNKHLTSHIWLGLIVAHNSFRLKDQYLDEKYLPVEKEQQRKRREEEARKEKG